MLSEERETVINLNMVDKTARIYTSQPEVWRKLEKLNGFKLCAEGWIDSKIVSKEFEFSRSFVRFTKHGLIIASPRRSKPISETHKQAMQEARLRSKSNSVAMTLGTSEPVQHGKPHQEVGKC